jgi:ATP-binding protein involved in chromosome partitioning
MSLGFMVDPESAVIWRGPMVMKAIVELLGNVAWGALDILVVDMPPGTGDAQLTLSQRVELAGAVVVTTPQDVALADAIKGVAMFRKVNVPVLGIVENMSYFLCPHCSGRTEIFDHGGGRQQAQRLEVPFLGEVPLDPAIRVAGDSGQPIVASAPESTQARTFLEIASRVTEALHSDGPGDRPVAGDSIFGRFRKAWSGSQK